MCKNLAVVVTAGGSSTRYGKTNKLLEKINGKEVILYSIEAFLPFEPTEIIVSASESLEFELKSIAKHIPNIKIVRGGDTRQKSIFNALKICKDVDLVAIHDAARPLIKSECIDLAIKKATEVGAAVVGVNAVDTIKRVDSDNKIIDTPDRNFLWCVQTPQVFDFDLIFQAHKKLEGECFSDDSGMVEYLGGNVYMVKGDYSNIKITTKKDIYLAELLLNNQ